MSEGNPYLVDLGPEPFKPEATDVIDRVYEYHEAYMTDDLNDLLNDVFQAGAEAGKDLLYMLTDGQRAMCAIVVFDAEVNNGGLAQFFVNRPELVDEVRRALSVVGATSTLNRYARILVLAERNWPILNERERVMRSHELAKDERENAEHDLYMKFFHAIEPEAKPFETAYYPSYGADDQASSGELQFDIFSTLNAFIESHPEQFQRLRS